MKKLPSIVFFGTGPVSLATLNGLKGHFEFEAIITKPPVERNRAPVVDWATANKAPFFTPANKDGLATLFSEQKFNSLVGLVVDYGLIIPDSVIDSFKFGIVNSHFSLLPKLRGADPITFAILNGEKQTGVTLMTIVAALDEGPIISQQGFKLDEQITTPELTKKLINLSTHMLIKDLPAYLQGKIQPVEQSKKIKPTYTRRLAKENGLIDWHKPAMQIAREVRAFVGWPGSYTKLANKDVIITKANAEVAQNNSKQPPGSVIADKNSLKIVCGDGILVIELVKPAGKKDMSGADFARGYLK